MKQKILEIRHQIAEVNHLAQFIALKETEWYQKKYEELRGLFYDLSLVDLKNSLTVLASTLEHALKEDETIFDDIVLYENGEEQLKVVLQARVWNKRLFYGVYLQDDRNYLYNNFYDSHSGLNEEMMRFFDGLSIFGIYSYTNRENINNFRVELKNRYAQEDDEREEVGKNFARNVVAFVNYVRCHKNQIEQEFKLLMDLFISRAKVDEQDN